ncbi:hypothetical protein Nepgr_021415 [Nepenthes gracilis]|uniref:Uncharacterized protein n=1 Tax=Nepenthes gracilis TaxID=150966 RepID=A0AAD3XX05_NEPGR|nr:hypothetical protein Nepgr_021415 [Nepenthes gracilis]
MRVDDGGDASGEVPFLLWSHLIDADAVALLRSGTGENPGPLHLVLWVLGFNDLTSCDLSSRAPSNMAADAPSCASSSCFVVDGRGAKKSWRTSKRTALAVPSEASIGSTSISMDKDVEFQTFHLHQLVSSSNSRPTSIHSKLIGFRMSSQHLKTSSYASEQSTAGGLLEDNQHRSQVHGQLSSSSTSIVEKTKAVPNNASATTSACNIESARGRQRE